MTPFNPSAPTTWRAGWTRRRRSNANAVLIEINTPGGLLDSTRQMVGKIIRLSRPGHRVCGSLWKPPPARRVFFLLEAADVAAMAPGSNAGASHPVAEGVKLDDTMKQKLENDTARLYAVLCLSQGTRCDGGRRCGCACPKSYSDAEAKQLNLIDLIAPDDASLLNALDGRTITRF